MTHAVLAEHVAIHVAGRPVLTDVSFGVERGTSFAILGQGEAPLLLLRCLAGEHRHFAGRLSILGHEPRARWRLRRRRVLVEGIPRIDSRFPELILFEARDHPEAGEFPAALRSVTSRGTAIVFATERPSLAEAADRIGILARGRIVAQASMSELSTRFRRITYSNRLTETRTEFGTELDEFDALKVRVRGWGITAFVSNFDPEAFERFQRLDGVENARADTLTLAEWFEELAGVPG